MNSDSSNHLKYIAEVCHVREVALRGEADLDYWKVQLDPRKLEPVPCSGNAQLVLTGVGAKFRGIPFRELSVSVLVHDSMDSPGFESVFLQQAFNSSRLFAFCERVFFHTPYRHAHVSVDVGPPVSIRVVTGDRESFLA